MAGGSIRLRVVMALRRVGRKEESSLETAAAIHSKFSSFPFFFDPFCLQKCNEGESERVIRAR